MDYLKDELYRRVAYDPSVFDFIQEAALDGLWYWDLINPKNEWINAKFWRVLGYDVRDVQANAPSAWLTLLFEDDRNLLETSLAKHLLDPNILFDEILRFKHRLGQTIWIKCRGMILRDESGVPHRMLGAHIDVTTQQQQYEDLQKNKEIFENAILGTNLGTWEWNIKSGERFYNERWAQMIGYTLEELGENNVEKWAALVHPDDLIQSNMNIQKCFRRELEFYEVELRIRHKEGHWIWVYDRGKVFNWDAQGNPLLMFGTHQEITEKKRVEEQLRISEQLFRGTFDTAGTGMALLDPEGSWTRMNRTLEQLLGYSSEEYEQLSMKHLTHPDDLAICSVIFREFLEQKRDFYQGSSRYRHQKGHYVHVILALSVVRDHEGTLLFYIAQFIDISEWRSTQQRLSESLKKLQDVLDGSKEVGIVETDLDGKIQIFNRGAENLLGYAAYEVIGVITPELFHAKEEIEQRAKECFEKTGKWPETFQEFMADIAAGRSERSQRMFVRKDGTTFPVQLDISGIMENGVCRGFLGIATDISYIKRTEKEITQLLQITQDQNARLKNFAHIVSHNLRSHASGIAILLDLLGQDFADIEFNDTYAHMVKASQNLTGTITHLSEVVDAQFIDKANLAVVPVHSVVERCLESLLPLAQNSNVQLINEVPQEFSVSAIPAYLDSIVFNFISNGIKYKQSCPTCFVRIYGFSEEEFNVVVFEDNGLGIDLDRHGSKLFGMYKTFHTHEESNGVGLFITKNQVEALGGRIEVVSSVNQGSTFKVYLPNGKD